MKKFIDQGKIRYIGLSNETPWGFSKFLQIAKDLGHKKYNKKKEQWEISPSITIKSYIYPEYVKCIRAGERL